MNESLIKKEPVATTIAKKKCKKSNLIYNRCSFYGYSDDKKLYTLPFKSEYSYLLNFMMIWKKMKPTNLAKIKEKEKVYNTKSKLYNKTFENYCHVYDELSDAKKDKLDFFIKLKTERL